MKKVVTTAIGLLAIILLSNAHAVITGSDHDFSTTGWSDGQICIVCHTPHHSQADDNAPLWNHAQTTAAFTPYSSPTLDSVFSGTGGEPMGVSKLCLSCHDGTVAIDAFGERGGSVSITGSALLTADLSDDHPVSIFWDDPSASHVTIDQTGGTCTTRCHALFSTTITGPLPFFPYGDGRMTIECATCHDVHNNTPFTSLLRESPDSSQLCFVCHQDKE